MGLQIDDINKLTEDIVSFDMRPEDTEVYWKYIRPLPAGAKVVDFGTGQAKNVIRMALVAPWVEIWTWDWGKGGESVPHSYFKMITDRLREFDIDNVYFTIADSDKAFPTWDWQIDVLNIDASHSFEGMLADLKRWEFYVRPGGYIFIHDYEYNKPNYKFEEMRDAVQQYFKEGYEFLEYLGGTQVIKKL